jgi:hypothetical protein
MEQDERRAAAPDPPRHHTLTAGGFDALGLGRDTFDDGHGFFADQSHRLTSLILLTG